MEYLILGGWIILIFLLVMMTFVGVGFLIGKMYHKKFRFRHLIHMFLLALVCAIPVGLAIKGHTGPWQALGLLWIMSAGFSLLLFCFSSIRKYWTLHRSLPWAIVSSLILGPISLMAMITV